VATAVDSRVFSNISATTAAFYLIGGYYMIAAVATFGGGNVELQCLAPDGSTWLSAPTALKLSAAGMISGYLPPGPNTASQSQLRRRFTPASQVCRFHS
jgi:hypothetical protein